MSLIYLILALITNIVCAYGFYNLLGWGGIAVFLLIGLLNILIEYKILGGAK